MNFVLEVKKKNGKKIGCNEEKSRKKGKIGLLLNKAVFIVRVRDKKKRKSFWLMVQSQGVSRWY